MKKKKKPSQLLSAGTLKALVLSESDMRRADDLAAHYGFGSRMSAIRFSLKRLYQRVMAGKKLPKFEPDKGGQRMPARWREEDLRMVAEIGKQAGEKSFTGVLRLAIYCEWLEAMK